MVALTPRQQKHPEMMLLLQCFLKHDVELLLAKRTAVEHRATVLRTQHWRLVSMNFFLTQCTIPLLKMPFEFTLTSPKISSLGGSACLVGVELAFSSYA
jgi:hypothetical protein